MEKAVSGWVKCGKRMPVSGIEVLAFGDLAPDAVGEIKLRQIQVAYYSKCDRKWTATGDTQYGAHMINVTHWQPLPGLPEE